MRGKRIVSLMLTLGCLMFVLPKQARGQEATGAEIFIPGDKDFKLELLSPISTATNKKGDTFTCLVLEPKDYEGARVSGRIKNLKRPKKVKGDSQMELEFQRIETSNGGGVFHAQIKEVYDVVDVAQGGRADSEGSVKGRSVVKRDMIKISAAVAIGATLGGIFGGTAGALAGGAIAGALASASVLTTSGPDLEFKQGTQFKVLTNAPKRPKNERQTTPASTTPRSSLTRRPPGNQPAASISQPVGVAAPSGRYKSYSTNTVYRLSFPDNWRDYSSGGTATLAPEGAYGVYNGRPGYTHCVMSGVAPAPRRDLQQSTEALVGGLLRTNTYLQQQGSYTRSVLAGRSSLGVSLAGRWPVTNHAEAINIYTALLRDGRLFYLITVVPQDEYAAYEQVFQTVVRSVQFND